MLESKKDNFFFSFVLEGYYKGSCCQTVVFNKVVCCVLHILLSVLHVAARDTLSVYWQIANHHKQRCVRHHLCICVLVFSPQADREPGKTFSTG